MNEESVKMETESSVLIRPLIATQHLQCRRIIQRIEPWSFAFDKAHALAKRMRHDQDIRKQDCGIKPEATNRQAVRAE